MAVYDEVLIANMALNLCGIGQRITALSDANDRAIACNTWYPIARDICLESYKWNFAKKTVALGLVEEFTSDTAKWAYSYRYPATCLSAYYLTVGTDPVTVPIPFELNQDATGRLIMTDLEDAELEGVFAFTDPGEWSSKFSMAVASHLAQYIALPLQKDQGMVDRKAQAARENLALAQAKSAGEKQNRPEPVSKYIRAMGGYNARNDNSRLEQL